MTANVAYALARKNCGGNADVSQYAKKNELPAPDNSTLVETNGIWKANYSNPNLLDNSDFSNPVNQRGLTEYDGRNGPNNSQYPYYNKTTIDRWTVARARLTIESEQKCISVGNNLDASNILLTQNYFDSDKFKGKTFTFSMKTINPDKFYVTTFTLPDVIPDWANAITINVVDGELNLRISETDGIFHFTLTFNTAYIHSLTNGKIYIEYVKLEKGAIATPYVKPNYADELKKCRLYFLPLGTYARCVSKVGNEYQFYYNHDRMMNQAPSAYIPKACIRVKNNGSDVSSFTLNSVSAADWGRGIVKVALEGTYDISNLWMLIDYYPPDGRLCYLSCEP